MTTLTLNSKEFISFVLAPTTRFNTDVTLYVDGGVISTTCYTSSVDKQQMYMLAETQVQVANPPDEPIVLRIGNPTRYIEILKQMGDETIDLLYDGSTLSYKSKAAAYKRFRFHLLAEDATAKTPLNRDTMRKLTGNTKFTMTFETARSAVNMITAMPLMNKLYFNAGDNGVICSLTDKEIDGSDSIDMQISDTFEGDRFEDLIITDSVLRIISGVKFDTCTIEVTKNRIMIFRIPYGQSTIIYVIPSKTR